MEKSGAHPRLKLAYVPQEPALDPAAYSISRKYQKESVQLSQVLFRYHETSHLLSDGAGDTEALLSRLQDLQAELEAHDGWSIQAKVETAIDKLSLAHRCVGRTAFRRSKKTRCAGSCAGAYRPMCCCWMNRPIIWTYSLSNGWKDYLRIFPGAWYSSRMTAAF